MIYCSVVVSCNHVIPQVTMPFQPYFYIATSKVSDVTVSCHDNIGHPRIQRERWHHSLARSCQDD